MSETNKNLRERIDSVVSQAAAIIVSRETNSSWGFVAALKRDWTRQVNDWFEDAEYRLVPFNCVVEYEWKDEEPGRMDSLAASGFLVTVRRDSASRDKVQKT